MKNKLVLTLLIGVLSLNIFGCNNDMEEVKSIEEVEEVGDDYNASLDQPIKCDKAINEVAFNIVMEAYTNAKNAKQGVAEISHMIGPERTIEYQISLMQDQPSQDTMLYYVSQDEESFNGYLYRYNWRGAGVETDLWTVTEFGWLATQTIPPYDVSPLDIFTLEDFTYSKVYEEPVTFLGEDESQDSTEYYTLLSTGFSEDEATKDIVRYCSVYIHKDTMLPTALVAEYVNYTSDVEVDATTGEYYEDVVSTDVILFTFNDEDITDKVQMNPEIDEIIDEQTYLQKLAEAEANAELESTESSEDSSDVVEDNQEADVNEQEDN